MKRKKLIVAGVLATALCATFAAGCSQAVNDYQFGFEVKHPVDPVSIELDEGAAIDGVKDGFYGENSLAFTETKSGIVVTTYAHLGEKGLYLFTETDDKSVYCSSEKQFFENDSVEYCIDPRPDHSVTVSALNQKVKVRTDCLQVRVNALGEHQTWFGRDTGGYPWVNGRFAVLTAARVNGTVNAQNGAEGYAVEAFVPYASLGLEEKPQAVGVLPAFNNVNNREDTARDWFTVKGMSHGEPTSYARVDETGFADIGDKIPPVKELTANAEDPAYVGAALPLVEVTEGNTSPETRATLKAYLGEDGVYFLAVVNDKVLSRGSDNIWNNDGIELLLDANANGGDSCFKDGVLRVGADIDGGVETDICLTGYGDYVPMRKAAFSKTLVSDFAGESAFGYRYTYVYELMVPYVSLGLNAKPQTLTVAWAVKSPNETAYILDRSNANGEMEGQDWLWTDKHFPQNPEEYYVITEEGATGEGLHPAYAFPDFSAYTFRSENPERYRYRGFATEEGIFLNVEQYVDSYKRGNSGGDWTQITHIEMEIWKDGFGSGDTYFAFFPDGSFYRNSENMTALEYTFRAENRGEQAEGYRYKLTYFIYFGFANNTSVNANVQFMSFTPGESAQGYEHAVGIIKDAGRSSERILYTDDCRYYPVTTENIGEKIAYAFPQWAAWEDCAVRSQAQSRYDYRAVANSEGISVNMVQYVNSYVGGGASGDWSTVTHIEMQIWNNDFGYGANGTYFAFFPDGSYYINNQTNVTSFENRTTITDRGADYDGFRYAISYEMHVGFANRNETRATFMSLTSDGNEGYENATTTERDGNRTLWTDDCLPYVIDESGLKAPLVFPEWGEWQGTDATERFNLRGHAETDGLYINIVQRTNGLTNTGDGFSAQNHVEMEIWKTGLGTGDTFFAFFADGTYYCNAPSNAPTVQYKVTKVDRGENAEGYRYELDYQIFIGFANDTSSNATVWLAQFMPNEDNTGWGNAKMTYRDGRLVYVEDCKNYSFGTQGFTKNTYAFPQWIDWNTTGRVTSLAPTRYDFRGYSAADGLYMNFVQFVDTIHYGSINQWSDQVTHIEMKIWHHGFGYGASHNAFNNTFAGFSLDGAYFLNDTTNVTNIEYRATVVDRGEGYTEGYRYMLSYEIYLAFVNNGDNGPYAYVDFKSLTPGESNVGYENSKVNTDDGRTGWWDGGGTHFMTGGVTQTGP